MKKIPFPVFVAASLLLGGCVQHKPKLPAPDIAIGELLQAPIASFASLKEFRGQVVVLEFWATWCGPCVELLPHMNKMVAAFAGKPVRFISVTDETRPPVEAFLKTHPMKAWIGLDPTGAAFQAFHVNSRPEVVVIDPFGRIWIRIHPSFLYKSDIEGALDASPPAAPPSAKS
ncbi:MAG TPA: TlpA disulfide reductase family protein [Elusimicrobiota bacterium]|jgi:thiol-disulfide isomerase/thioredoxin|nr:TlpA disulfide reductase family protein [Elusimicrobiota bacterium]